MWKRIDLLTIKSDYKVLTMTGLFFYSGKTTHLIIFETENLEKSKKLSQLKENKFKGKGQVEVVDTLWLFESMKKGELLPVDQFRVPYWCVANISPINTHKHFK